MYTEPHILVVDDEPLVALLIGDCLAELGYQVVGPVAKASEAMRLLEEAQLDGALLDVNLGTGDSFTLADAVRAKGIPLAFITGDASAGALPARFSDLPVLGKPFEFEAMQALTAGLFPAIPGMPANSQSP
jgi:CheY-like chemotaxis protein